MKLSQLKNHKVLHTGRIKQYPILISHNGTRYTRKEKRIYPQDPTNVKPIYIEYYYEKAIIEK